jgi:hypothetical protein
VKKVEKDVERDVEKEWKAAEQVSICVVSCPYADGDHASVVFGGTRTDCYVNRRWNRFSRMLRRM